ncbi:MAG: iron-containing alcohol dehydrogenase [Alphaproteobacteria bacterium]|nr:MAG: iron-containing alcohol dehydrogenase [Alphaproteobacteria bacterium]
MLATILAPRIMIVGGGALAQTAAVVRRLGCTKPLVVSDRFLERTGVTTRLGTVLTEGGLTPGWFLDTVPDPTSEVVAAGLAAVQAGDYDCLIALGGGSPMDTAKAIAILDAGGGHIRDYKVPASADRARLPILCIPTTAGTGSEVTRFTVITDTASDEKMLITGLGCLPSAAIVDYELTLTKPFRLTADTGIDSLTHAIEAYVSRRANPISDLYALEAMDILHTNLRTACREPSNHQAREAMMRGATLAGLAFSNASVALVHGMSRPIGAFFHVPHGLSNAMLLPAVTRFSLAAALPRYAACARAMGVAATQASDEAAGAALLDALDALNRDLEVPSPQRYGIDEARYHSLLETMARQALASGSPANNPAVPTEAEIIDLYRAVWA